MQSQDRLPLPEISDWFWNIIGAAQGSRQSLRTLLLSLSKEDIRRFQEEFLDAAAELQDTPFSEYAEESEDGLEDIANWVVSHGKEAFIAVWNHPTKMPYSVEGDEEAILYGVANQVYEERFGEPLDIY